MKKFVLMLLALLTLFSFTACDSGKTSGGKDAYRSSTATDLSSDELQQLIKDAQASSGQN